jgi:general secretion pathway protein D
MALVKRCGMSHRWPALVGLLVLLPRGAMAQSHKELEPSGAASAAVDEVLYSCKTHTGPVTVTFKPETEVKDLVTWVMGFTCKNFVLDPRIVMTGRKVTMIVPNKMAANEAYQTFLVALSTIGLAVIAKGNVMRIVESATAKKEVLPIYKQVPGDSDQVVRVVIRPSYAQPEALRQAFASIKSDAGDITVVGSFLVVTDYASALTGMMSLKKLVDVPGGTEGLYTIPIHHGEATKIAQMLTTMFGTTTGAAPPKPGTDLATASELVPSKILVDERTNTLVISATEPAYQRAKALVDRIDVSVDMEAGGSIHTYQLASAIAEELAQTLTKAISGESGAARTQRPTTPGAPAQPQPPPSPLDGLGASLQGAVHVIADKSTNKLLITSSNRDFVSLKDVIQQLDQPRRQVYIEAMILEVDVSNSLNFGASAHGGDTNKSGSTLGFGGIQLPGLSSVDPTSALSGGGLIGGLLGTASFSLLGTTIPSYGVLVQALATRSNANILSTPSIIALDNEEAKSKIGENIPYLSSAVPASVNSTLTTTSIARQPLELELDIKPHISSDDTILLEIKHSAGGVKDLTGTLGPTWTTRSVETRVVVRDQQTVLIGGLMQDTETTGVSQVPILGDIPLLGYLFKYTKKLKHKTNLLIMLTPYIIKDQRDLQRIQQRKLRQNDEFFGAVTSLESMKFAPEIDYHRKRGLIEEINRAVIDAEADAAARAAVAPPAGLPAGPIEIPREPDAH